MDGLTGMVDWVSALEINDANNDNSYYDMTNERAKERTINDGCYQSGVGLHGFIGHIVVKGRNIMNIMHIMHVKIKSI
jgi:hypothetical protein